jgi:two-component system LytT family response regulator
MNVRTLIVDDEPLARDRLTALVAAEPGLEKVGESAAVAEAVAAIKDLRPDLVFLDVQMPGGTGFDVLEALPPDEVPLVIFVTAYDQFALKAFDVHALDYLVKPFDRDRFRKAVARAREHLERRQAGGGSDPRLVALMNDVQGKPRPLERLVVKSGGRVYFLRLEEIDWIEAAGNYLKLHVGGETHLLRETMGDLEARLDPRQFLRIHRSTIVNVERIQELQPLFHGDYVVILRGGKELTLSRNYRKKIEDALGATF